MAWETARSWWSQGYTAPLGIVADHRPVFESWTEDDLSFWEVRVGSDDIAYTHYSGHTADLLLLRDLPRSRRTQKGRR